MTQSDRPARRATSHGPKRRTDTARPASDRRPWPTASTISRVSPAKPGSKRAGTGSRSSNQPPTPATVWTAGAHAIDLDASWPTPIIAKVVESFSKPGGRVVLLPWPASDSNHRFGVASANGVITHAPEAELVEALAAVEALDRHGRVECVAVGDDLTGSVSRPFWADLFTDERISATAPAAAPRHVDSTVVDGLSAASANANLIVTSLGSGDDVDRFSELVALIAARLLRVGGILAVVTHSDSSRGELTDPTGALVAAAQNADLLYLQHIVALHTPVRDGRLAIELLADTDSSAAEQYAHAAHRAAVRGLPTPHRRVHSDVLVFAQPHEHEPLPVRQAEQAIESGVLR